MLDAAVGGKPRYSSIRIGLDVERVPPAPEDVGLAEELFRRVFRAGGTGSMPVMEALLELIAAARDPATVPFWREVIALSRPRDKSAGIRHNLALAALAELLAEHSVPAAYEALREAAHNPSAEVRTLAVEYMEDAYLYVERPLPAEVVAELTDIATHDPALGPRFQARLALQDAQAPVPHENAGGTYAFKVWLVRTPQSYRVLELRSEQTLDDLHDAIQQAMNWDADHLYSFFLSGIPYDESTSFSCPMEEGERCTEDAAIGDLGLRVGDVFAYLFDYGDDNVFGVEVVSVQPQAQQGVQYPRIVEKHGRAPRQYRY